MDRSLVGKFFHVLSAEDGKIDGQGVVVGQPQPEWYLVQYYEWLHGDPIFMELVHISTMTSSAKLEGAESRLVLWRFYPSQEDMKYAFVYGGRKRT